MEEAVDTFTSFTGASSEVARRYLGMTENNAEQAIQLFFDSPDLASSIGQHTSSATSDLQPSTTQPSGPSPAGRDTSRNPIQIDSDDDGMDIDPDDYDADRAAIEAAATADYEDDAALARKMQEELYAGGDSNPGFDADGVRAPIARTTETLIGGPDDWSSEDMNSAILQQMRARNQPRNSGRPGVFNQRPVTSIWDEGSSSNTRRQGLAQATGGASEQSAKAARLAELFRPPFELMSQVPWDAAREEGKEDKKWILINVQDPSIFDCQQLNRDIWKHDGIKELIKENFIFLQYSKDDPRGAQYCQYYFPLKDSDAAYPHIAIVDPRTGEQVKVWSGPPVPKPGDFLMQLVEFLDRYSLDVTKKNPVAKRKPEKSKSVDVDRLTEDEMLELALKNSLAADAAGPRDDDPDDLTKSSSNINKGKGKEVEASQGDGINVTNGDENTLSEETSLFSGITSQNPHTEPAPSPVVTRIQFRHSNGRIVRRFNAQDQVLRIYEWLKAEPLEDKAGMEFELKGIGKDLISHLDETIEEAGLKNGTVMVEYIED